MLQYGLLSASFIPPADQSDLRELTQNRTGLIEDRVPVVNWLQKVLVGGNYFDER